nr:flagellar filament capping protein FliD [uncultured Oribacterium sp.]
MSGLSTNSTSGTSSLGNTSLRGFGGMSSGIDRDALIEQATKGTQLKLTKAKQETTRLEWRQEAFRELSDKTIALQDDFLSFASSDSIKSPELYESSVVNPQGDAAATKFITASGHSDLTKNLKVKAVTKLATSESIVSDVKGSASAIKTGITADALAAVGNAKTSTLVGKSLQLGNYTTKGVFQEKASFTFPASYKDDNGKTVEIDYTGDKQKLVDDLNKAAKQGNVKLGENEFLSFSYQQGSNPGEDYIQINAGTSQYVIKSGSSALDALGYKAPPAGSTPAGTGSDAYGVKIAAFNSSTQAEGKFTASAVKESSMLDYLQEKKLTVSYGGASQEISLLTEAQKQSIEAAHTGTSASDNQNRLDAVKDAIQQNLNNAFGTGKIVVDSSTGSITFNSANGKDTVSVSSSDAQVRANLQISKNASNKVTTSSSIMDNLDKLGLSEYVGNKAGLEEALSKFKINGKEIKGITADSTVQDMLKKINDSDAGVKASYMEGSGRFVLIHSETGSGRSITLGDANNANDIEDKLFGATASGGGQVNHGTDAEMVFDYGNGINETVTSSSNTFNIDGVKITASGKFGVELDASGNAVTKPDGSYKFDSSKEVSFTSKADVDKAAATMKKFVEKFNDLVSSVNTHAKTRRSSGYDPLTEAQKNQMSEKSIENWEKKAKEGILYGESSIRNFSDSLQTVMTQMMSDLKVAGLDYQDMEKMGLSMTTDSFDGGKLSFDETKFKKAMETEPEKVAKVMTGHNGSKGLAKIVETTVSRYATRYASRNGGSYGELIKEAGSNKVTLSNTSSVIYGKLKENSEAIEKFKTMLSNQQDRYIKQFSQLEKLISKMNTQSSYLSSL